MSVPCVSQTARMLTRATVKRRSVCEKDKACHIKAVVEKKFEWHHKTRNENEKPWDNI